MQHRVGGERLGNAAIGINVGEIELAAGLQQAMRGAQHGRLVGNEVDDAVRHDRVKAPFRQVERVKPLDITFDEANVRPRVAEAVAVPVEVSIGDGQLRRRRIDAGHRAVLADQLGEEKNILSRSRAEVEDMRALDRLRDHQAAAVIMRFDLVMDVGERGADLRWWCSERAAGVGAQVGRSAEDLAVIALAVFEIHRMAFEARGGLCELFLIAVAAMFNIRRSRWGRSFVSVERS